MRQGLLRRLDLAYHARRAVIRVVFMGSGEFGCPALEALLRDERVRVEGVVTAPDRPRGRHLRPAPCPVRALALARGLPNLMPERVTAPEFLADLRRWDPELIVMAAYGKYVPRELLDLPPRGVINVHPSLLPRYRGAAPIAWAIARGETETGVTVLFVNEKMDAGDVILQRRTPIGPDETAAELAPRLARIGAELLTEAVGFFQRGDVPRVPQDEAQATLAPKLKKEDGRVRWTEPAETIRNKVRAFQPWPGCFCEAPRGSGRRLRIQRARVEPGEGTPGVVLEARGEGPLIATGAGALRLLQVQPENRRPMSGAAFLCGHRVAVGEQWG